MPNAEYITTQGDRWDTIAFKAYGDATNFSGIIDANPNLPETDVFEGGIKLIVPILVEPINSNLDQLPPWKRVQAELSASVKENAESISNINVTPASFDKSFD